jgi:hypothetical protein
VIAIRSLWRVMAWNGVWKCRSWVAGGEGSGGWRDKRAAGCGGCEAQNSLASRAIHFIALLARRFVFPAIPPFSQPSPVGNDIFQ